jgi:hypothetical protein
MAGDAEADLVRGQTAESDISGQFIFLDVETDASKLDAKCQGDEDPHIVVGVAIPESVLHLELPAAKREVAERRDRALDAVGVLGIGAQIGVVERGDQLVVVQDPVSVMELDVFGVKMEAAEDLGKKGAQISNFLARRA